MMKAIDLAKELKESIDSKIKRDSDLRYLEKSPEYLVCCALLEAEKVIEFYEPVVRQYGCTPNGDHDDPSWCTERCCDYGKRARNWLSTHREGGEQ